MRRGVLLVDRPGEIVENRNNRQRQTGVRDPCLAPRTVRRLMTMWLGGVGLALVPVSYGVHCLISGHAVLPGGSDIEIGSGGGGLDVYGRAAEALATAYITLGVLVHIQLFWGMHPRLNYIYEVLRLVALLIFIVSLGLGIYWIFASGN